MGSKLIYDVGMHIGSDTEFYLKKGFNVIAIEANPVLASQCQMKFSNFIASGQLQLLNVAIGETSGKDQLYVSNENSEWTTLVAEAAAVKQREHGASFRTIEVDTVRFDSVLEKYGIPYYMKIDIEGCDLLCLKALLKFDERPKYISLEVSQENPFMELLNLYDLGYRQFKFLNQAINKEIKLPNPPKEGVYVDVEFEMGMSGPFGEETPHRWVSIDRAVLQNHEILSRYRHASSRRIVDRLWQKVLTRLKREPSGWHDVHAKI